MRLVCTAFLCFNSVNVDRMFLPAAAAIVIVIYLLQFKDFINFEIWSVIIHKNKYCVIQRVQK